MMKGIYTWQTLLLLAVEKGVLRRITFSKPQGQDLPQKATGRLCKNGKEALLAMEEFLQDGKVRHKNISLSALYEAAETLGEGYGQINIATALGDAEYRRNKKGSSVLLGGEKLYQALEGKAFAEEITESLFHKKAYILSGDEPFLMALGITAKDGRIHDKKQAKFRQINRFLEHVKDAAAHLPKEGTLRIADLCCGKSYLSFAVYHYFAHLCKRQVEMLCMDLKADVMADCAQIAEGLGFSGMRFVAGDVRKAPKTPAPHLVLSLHACDVATDIVLRFAAEAEAAVVLSTPCCHHYLKGRLGCDSLAFVSKYPHLEGKLCEVLTDAARLARLRAFGYEVAALELTDPEDTPKNTLLRAIRREMPASAKAEAMGEYRQILRFLLGREAEDLPEEL